MSESKITGKRLPEGWGDWYADRRQTASNLVDSVVQEVVRRKPINTQSTEELKKPRTINIQEGAGLEELFSIANSTNAEWILEKIRFHESTLLCGTQLTGIEAIQHAKGVWEEREFIQGRQCLLEALQKANPKLAQCKTLEAALQNKEEIASITALSIIGKKMCMLPPEISQIENLQKLYLSFNQLRKLPPQLRFLKHLHLLDISYNDFEEVPSPIFRLSSLQNLNVAHNCLKRLSSEVAQLENLQELLLQENYLQELPSQIGTLIRLQKLNVYGNLLSTLPSEIGQLTNLRELWISENELRELPEEVGNLISIEHLHFTPQQVAQVRNLIGLEHVLNNANSSNTEQVLGEIQWRNPRLLENLSLIDNETAVAEAKIRWARDLLDGQMCLLAAIKEKCPQARNCKTLEEALRNRQTRFDITELSLASKKLRVLPPEIMALPNLRVLDLSYNELTEIPIEISYLKNLQNLRLDHNFLKLLPPGFGQLSGLRELNLRNNKFLKRPIQLRHLPQLQKVDTDI